MKNPLRIILHDSFRVGITLKGLDGLLETLAGLLLLVARPEVLARIVQYIGNSNWLWDVNGYVADHLLQASERLSSGGKMFAAVFLLAHGLAKVILVVGLWFDRLWAYPLLMGVLSAFIVFQMHRYERTHSVTMLVFSAFDALVIYLTWREYQLRLQGERSPAK
jgi:uncharacterized membrane protein